MITFVKKKLKYKVLLNSASFSEGTWLNVIKLEGKESVTLCNLYRSPNSGIISSFCRNIVTLLDDLIDTSKLIVVGDFNIDVKKDNYYSGRLTRELELLGLKQKINVPTRTTLTSDTIIDLVFTNCKIKCNVLTTPRITDHNILVLTINEKLGNSLDRKVISKRDFNSIDYDIFEHRLKNNLNDLMLDLSNEKILISNKLEYNLFVNNVIVSLINTVDELAPIENKIVNSKWEKKPWINNEIIIKIKMRDKAFYAAKNSKNIRDLEHYKSLRNDVVNNLRLAKKDYYETNIDKIKPIQKLCGLKLNN